MQELLGSESGFLDEIGGRVGELQGPAADAARSSLSQAATAVADLRATVAASTPRGRIPLITRRYDLRAEAPRFHEAADGVRRAHNALFALDGVAPTGYDDAVRGAADLAIAPADHPLVAIDPARQQGVVRALGRHGLPIRIVTHGAENIPSEGAFLLAPSHGSLLDSTAIYWAGHNRALHTMTHAPRALLTALRGSGAFPVERGAGQADEALAVTRGLIARGEGVAMYPEGTITRADTLTRPRSGIGRIAVEMEVPVVPAAAHGNKGWYTRGSRPGIPEVHVVYGPAIQVTGKAMNYRNAEAAREEIWRGVEAADAEARRFRAAARS